jgi:5-methylcytosine-specific restriction endonuclease McrA
MVQKRSWANSNRRARLPRDWNARRAQVFRRDNFRCVIPLPDGTRCPGAAEECDHIFPGDNHSLSNLQSLCSWHHKQKSSREGADALAAKKARIASRFPKPDM